MYCMASPTQLTFSFDCYKYSLFNNQIFNLIYIFQ